MIQLVVGRAPTLRQHVPYVVDHTQQATEAVNTIIDYIEVAVTISTVLPINHQEKDKQKEHKQDEDEQDV
jgi:hypothetical protein